MKKSAEFNIDDLYKTSFENADFAFDKSAMWSEVESQLPGKERRFLFWLSWVLGILMLSYFLLLLAWAPTDKKQHVELSFLPATISKATSQTGHPQMTMPTTPSTKNVLPISSEKEKETSTTPYEDDDQLKVIAEPDTENDEMLPHNSLSIVNSIDNRSTLSAFSNTTLDNISGINMLFMEEEGQPRRPDPNSWSRCSVKDRPLFFSDIYAFGGYPLISNSINPEPTNDYNSFLEQWNEGEEAVANYGFGMMVGIGAYWGGSFSTGLEYQQIQNKINRSQTVIERITVFDEMAYYYLDSNNNRVWVADSVTSTRVYTREIQAAKTHTLINVPFLLGYHLENERWRVGLTAGVNLHVMHHFEGKVLDPSGQIIEATTGTPTAVYDTNMGVSFIGGIDFGYFITLQTELYISPRFRYNPRSWLNPSHPLESRIQMVNLQAGARWHF